MFKKLRTVVYHVGDLPAAKEWYTRITGITPYFDAPFYIGFDINGNELGLDPDMTGIEPGNTSCVYWAVDDIAGCVQRLLDAGGTMADVLKEVGGGVQVAVIKDPWGNAIGLIEGA